MRSKYETHIEPNLEAIRTMREGGVRMADIAKAIGVGKTTLAKYQKQNPTLANILKEASTVLDEDMQRLAEEGLKAKLVGRWQETKRITEDKFDKAGNLVTLVYLEKKWVEPDTTAIIFTLKAKAPSKWNKAEDDITSARKAKVEAETERIKKGEGKADDLPRLLGDYISNE